MNTNTPTATPLFEVRDLRVEHAAPGGQKLNAVNGVSLRLREGSILGVVGESGCGKSSLARAMLGLLPVAAGSLFYRGQELTTLASRRRRGTQRGIQHVFQDPANSLSPRRTIRQTLEEPLALYRMAGRDEWPGRIARVLEAVGLGSELLDRYPNELSGGQKQRIALARALLPDPDLIIADEPVSSLDVSAQARVIERIRHARKTFGTAFLLISHDLAVIRQLADDVSVMYLGRLVESGPADRVFAEPAHPYTQALLAAARGNGAPGSGLKGEPPSPLTPPPGCVFHTRCPRAMDRCSRLNPGFTVAAQDDCGAQTHLVRCHLWN
ncbi:ABC transporter ATP-binding protein [Elongatibacter sediminis]|uniref:ABC transporter ATP-binding protein n=1 Tax=Elongatibacter sediminis TaxID=3119006 RepID=A0AAW9R7M7_9GAMM